MVGFTLVVLLIGLPSASANPDAKRLYDDLLSNYNRLIRPVSNNTDKVLVRLGMRLSQLIDLVSPPLSLSSYFLSRFGHPLPPSQHEGREKVFLIS